MLSCFVCARNNKTPHRRQTNVVLLIDFTFLFFITRIIAIIDSGESDKYNIIVLKHIRSGGAFILGSYIIFLAHRRLSHEYNTRFFYTQVTKTAIYI
jgi:hypothetical protein